jgi:two-component sensor histidine kinase
MISIARDIESIKQVERDLRAADEHKAILLDDINHRAKNSLASVAGLLELRRMEIEDPGAKSAIGSSVRQLVVLSRVFDRLHQSRNTESIPVRAFLEDLCNDLRQSIVGNRVVLRANIEEAAVAMDRAISLGLIVNELVANALKHAFPGDRSGEIVVRLNADRPSGLCLEVEDDGIGLSTGTPEGTGRALVDALARQLGGGVEWRRSPGTSARIRFPDVADAA